MQSHKVEKKSINSPKNWLTLQPAIQENLCCCQVTDYDVKEMMKEVGVEIQGRIYYEDFVKMMTGKIGRAHRRVSAWLLVSQSDSIIIFIFFFFVIFKTWCWLVDIASIWGVDYKQSNKCMWVRPYGVLHIVHLSALVAGNLHDSPTPVWSFVWWPN